MGCDVYLFRKEYVSYDKETETDLVKQQKFWSVKSYKLGIAFAEIFGADVDWTLVGLDQFEKVCKQMISHGEDDCGEYPDGALFKIPVLGGASSFILSDIVSPVTFSPNGDSISFIRLHSEQAEEALMVAAADGSGHRKLASRFNQEFFLVTR